MNRDNTSLLKNFQAVFPVSTVKFEKFVKLQFQKLKVLPLQKNALIVSKAAPLLRQSLMRLKIAAFLKYHN